jgi:hypothetical protein
MLFAVLILHSLVTTAQQPPVAANTATQQVPAPVAWLDHLRISTFSVGRVMTDDNTLRQFFEVLGTAVFVGLDEHTGYIVTARHVFFEPEKNWHPTEVRLRFAWQEDKSVFDELGVTLTLRRLRKRFMEIFG